MQKSDLDALFHMASHGNKEAYYLLYKTIVDKANKLIISMIKRSTNFRGFPGDFCEIIDDIFFKAVNDYEPRIGSFSSYVNWLFDRRLKNAVLKEIIDVQNYTKTVKCDDEEYDEIENIADTKSLSITDQIALENFELHISSPNKHKRLRERERDKVLLLNYAGYTKVEIAKFLKLTYAEVRYILEKVKDEDIGDIELDLK